MCVVCLCGVGGCERWFYDVTRLVVSLKIRSFEALQWTRLTLRLHACLAVAALLRSIGDPLAGNSVVVVAAVVVEIVVVVAVVVAAVEIVIVEIIIVAIAVVVVVEVVEGVVVEVGQTAVVEGTAEVGSAFLPVLREPWSEGLRSLL